MAWVTGQKATKSRCAGQHDLCVPTPPPPESWIKPLRPRTGRRENRDRDVTRLLRPVPHPVPRPVPHPVYVPSLLPVRLSNQG